MSEETVSLYIVHWQTQTGPGATFYKGKEKVWAEHKQAATALARFFVWRRAFQEYGMRHIIVTKVEGA